ncbi:MAG: 30S ribosomal protein S20 [Armatimonadetes bacterium]|nr:30S ribosomal protein S20 [Armatimonadota bacterium]
MAEAAKKVKKKVKKIEDHKGKRLKNSKVKSSIKTVFKKAEEVVQSKSQEAKNKVLEALKIVDKAASKGIIHKNKAARKKSRLMKKYNQLIKV